MSTPARHSSTAHLPSRDPPSFVLQRLLDEINEHKDAPRSDPVFVATDGPSSRKHSLDSRRSSVNCNTPPQHQHHRSSVWAKGNTIAEDARQKLRALDEARLGKQPTNSQSSQVDRFAASSNVVAAKQTPPNPSSPPMFQEFRFNRAATFTTIDTPSPSSEFPNSFFRGKRERTDAYSPELLSKRLRHGSFSDMTCRDRAVGAPSPPAANIMRGGGPVVTTYIRTPSPSDPVLHLDPLPEAPPSPSPASRTGTTPKHAYKSFNPSTPRRSPTPSDQGSLDGTPAWARPFHLVDHADDHLSIYKNVHGDEAQDHPLCLYCFRQHGNFHKILDSGCEVCGRKELLEGHYWDTPFWAQ